LQQIENKAEILKKRISGALQTGKTNEIRVGRAWSRVFQPIANGLGEATKILDNTNDEVDYFRSQIAPLPRLSKPFYSTLTLD